MYTDRQKYSCTWSDFQEITNENIEYFCGSVYNARSDHAVEMTSIFYSCFILDDQLKLVDG